VLPGYGTTIGPDANGDPCEEFTLVPGTPKVITVDNTPCPASLSDLAVTVTIPNVLQASDGPQDFTIDVTGPKGALPSQTAHFTAGQTSHVLHFTPPIAGTYTVSQQPAAPFFPVIPLSPVIAVPGCTNTAQIDNNFGPASVE